MASSLPPGWRGPFSAPDRDDWVERHAASIPAKKVWKVAKREAEPFVTQTIAPMQARIAELERLLIRVATNAPPYALGDELYAQVVDATAHRSSYPAEWASQARDRIRRLEQRRDFLKQKIEDAEIADRAPNHHHRAECAALTWALAFLYTIVGEAPKPGGPETEQDHDG